MIEMDTAKLTKRLPKSEQLLLCRATLGKWEKGGKVWKMSETEVSDSFKITPPQKPYRPVEEYRASVSYMLDHRVELIKDGWVQTEATYPELTKWLGEDGLPIPVRPELLEYMNEGESRAEGDDGLSALFENFFDR